MPATDGPSRRDLEEAMIAVAPNAGFLLAVNAPEAIREASAR